MIKNTTPVSVLLVDDNPAKLLALGAALEGMAVDIVTATSGMAALHQLLAQEFAVVLLDVNMPVMNGFETATLIRSRPRSEHLPILFITSEALTDESRLQGYALGAVDYVLSPVLPLILRAKVATFADLYRLREQSVRQNLELTETQARLNRMNSSLEEMVQARTAALQENEALLRDSQRIAQLGSYVLDIPTGLWKSSAMLDQLFGIEASYEHSMERWGDLIHPDDRAMMTRAFKKEVLEPGKDFDKEYRIIRHDDKTERWVHEIGKIELDDQGRPLKMHGTVQDITERKRLLEELETARQREQEARELASMEQLARSPGSSVTEQAYQVLRLQENAPEFFEALVQRFEKLLDKALEQRVLRVDYNIGNELRTMADQLGAVKVMPRDVIDIYLQAVKARSRDVPPQKAQAYAEEGRFLVLELMGDLVTFYRKYFSNSFRGSAASKD